jgi:hypothetical protein
LDQELFLATFLFGDAGVTVAGKRLWDQKLERMYAKNAGLRRRILTNFREVEVRSPSGLFIRKGMAVQLEDHRILKVIEQIVRGLYYFEFDEPLPNSTTFRSQFAQSSEAMAPMELIKHQLKLGARDWPGLFEYRFNRVSERPEASIWIMRFWGVNVFWAITNKKAETA